MRFEELFIKLTRQMQFIKYEINKNFDVNVAFETMNNRGKKLTNLELLKNRLIYLVSIMPNEPNDKRSHRKNAITKLINDRWGTIYEWLGRDKNKQLSDDDFLRNHWILYFGYSRNKSNEYVRYLLNTYFTVESALGKPLLNVDVDSQDETEELDDSYDYENIETPLENSERLTLDDIEKYATDLAFVSKEWYYTFFPEADFLNFQEQNYSEH